VPVDVEITKFDTAGDHAWTPPEGVESALVQLWSPPGGPGASTSEVGGGGGGGGGWTAKIIPLTGDECTIHVGDYPNDDSWFSQDGGTTKDLTCFAGENGVTKIGGAGSSGGDGTYTAGGGDGGDAQYTIPFVGTFDSDTGGGGGAGGDPCVSGNPASGSGVGTVDSYGGLGVCRGGSGGNGGAPGEPGLDGSQRGGAPGGGGSGESGGVGFPGRAVIIAPPPDAGELFVPGQCCCPTREQVGLPETLSISFSLLEANDDDMPADIQRVDCGTNGYALDKMVFSTAPFSAWSGGLELELIEDLSDFPWGAFEPEACGGGCTWLYSTPATEIEKPEPCDDPFWTPGHGVPASAVFPAYSVAAEVFEVTYNGTMTPDCVEATYDSINFDPASDYNCGMEGYLAGGPPGPGNKCCAQGAVTYFESETYTSHEIVADGISYFYTTCDDPGSGGPAPSSLVTWGITVTCSQVHPHTITVVDGHTYIPENAWVYAFAAITINGSIVSICLYFGYGQYCTDYNGDYDYVGPHLTGVCTDGAPGNNCEILGPRVYNSGTATPWTGGTPECISGAGLGFGLSCTLDLSEVSGATIWDKIKNSTDWQSAFSLFGCNCGSPGCTGEYHYSNANQCMVAYSCWSTPFDYSGYDMDGAPIHRVCYYAAGTAEFSLSD